MNSKFGPIKYNFQFNPEFCLSITQNSLKTLFVFFLNKGVDIFSFFVTHFRVGFVCSAGLEKSSAGLEPPLPPSPLQCLEIYNMLIQLSLELTRRKMKWRLDRAPKGMTPMQCLTRYQDSLHPPQELEIKSPFSIKKIIIRVGGGVECSTSKNGIIPNFLFKQDKRKLIELIHFTFFNLRFSIFLSVCPCVTNSSFR